MKKPHIPAIRALLRDHPEGLTAKEILTLLPHISKTTVVKSSLSKMPDAYIDRWVLKAGNRGQHEAVWMVVIPPPNCPHPKDRFYTEEDRPKTVWKVFL